MKTYISIDGVMSREDHTQEITEEVFEKFNDEFIELVEKYGFAFGGGFGHHTEEELLKIQGE